MRSRIVLDEIRAHPELVETVDDIAKIPRLSRWQKLVLDIAICDLAHDNLISEAADGRLCVRAEGRLFS